MSDASHVEWLLENAGPVIRYRTAHELIGGISSSEERKLRRDLLECAEVQKWLHALESCKRLGGSKDSSAVNSIAKLAAYGLTAEMPELRHLLEAARAKFYLDTPRKPGDPSHLQWQPATLYPMFISICLQSDQHRIELPIVIKHLFSQGNSFQSWRWPKKSKSSLI